MPTQKQLKTGELGVERTLLTRNLHKIRLSRRRIEMP
jgi:hypothetical protein